MAISLAKFKRQNPGVKIKVYNQEHPNGVIVKACRGKREMTWAWGKTLEEALALLSRRLLKASFLASAAASGYRDANTGEAGPLEGHHIVKRSQGRDDSPENIAPVTPRTHRVQHRQK
jgi:hypothetical protein